MATNQQRRAAERRLLQKQLEERRVREARRKRTVLIASIVGALVVVAAVIVAVVSASSGGGSGSKGKPAAGASISAAPSSSAGPSSTAPSSSAPVTGVPTTFDGVTVKNSKDLTREPGVTSTSATAPAKLEYKDLVVGKGKAATPASTVTVQYTGVLYKDGTGFDSSWSRGQAATFSLKQVVPGFTQGIGGTTGVPPMKVGGRRIMILPASLGYGSQGQSSIPPNSPLVFVVDLTKVSG